MWKRLICALLAVVFCTTAADAILPAAEHISVTGYDSEADYLREMRSCAQDGSEYAMQMGILYERQRNLKIEEMGLPERRTYYFTTCVTGEEVLTAMKGDRLKAQHPTAGQVWVYLHGKGYSDAVIAGILGNMMAECGGQTLELQWNLYGGGGTYYGLCMWSLYYGPAVGGASLTGQLDYLTQTLAANMTQFGGDYARFCAMTDPGQAARYFCRFYERGAGEGVRASNAYRALAWLQS